MWNSLGSLRERVREHAKSAAQVAQGVLQAAAAEEEYSPEPERDNNQHESVGWGKWGQPNQPSDDVASSAFQSHDPVPPPPSEDLPLPPMEDASPPPPPEDSFVSAKPPVFNSGPRGRRGSRYVVTGVATAQTKGDAPPVPKPSLFAPKPPVIGSKPASAATDETADRNDTASGIQEETPGDPPANRARLDDTESIPHEQPNHARAPLPAHSASPGNHAMSEISPFATSVATTAKAEGELLDEQSTITSPPEESFANWGLLTEQQNGESTTAPLAHDSFADWGFEVSTTESVQPGSVPPPPTNGRNATWNVPETVAEQQQCSETETNPVDGSFSEWAASDTFFETISEPQESQNTSMDHAKDGLAGWGVPGMSAEQKESPDTAGAPAEDAFAGWGVPEMSRQEQPGQSMETSPPDLTDSKIRESIPDETSIEQNETPDASDGPATGRAAGWDTHDAPAEIPAAEHSKRSTVEDTTGDDLDDLSTIGVSLEQKETPDNAETTENTFSGRNIPETSKKRQNGQGVDAPLNEKSFANWGTPEIPGEERQGLSTEKPPETDSFASWSVPETSLGEQKSQSATPATTDDSFAAWDVPVAFGGQQQHELNGWDIGSSETKVNEPRKGGDSEKEAGLTDWGEARGWNIDDASSAVKDAGDGADWFSSGTPGAGAQDTTDRTKKEPEIATEEQFEEKRTSEATEPKLLHNDFEPILKPGLPTRTVSEDLSRRSETTEKHDMTTRPTSELGSRNSEHMSDAKKEGTDDENHEFKITSGMPDVVSYNGDNGWALDATVGAVGNGVDTSSSSAVEGQQNFETETIVEPQDPVLRNPIITSDPVQAAEPWFSDQATRDTLQGTVPQHEVQPEARLYEPKRSQQVEQGELISQSSKMTLQIRALEEQMRNYMLERDSALSAKEASEREKDDLKKAIALVESDLAQSREESGYLAMQRDTLESERDAALEQRLEVEKERDEAIQRGGEGLREARSVIEAMRSNQDSTEKREAAITEQIGTLRTDVDRISQERNTFLAEAEDLRVMLKDTESQSRQREDELRQRLQFAEHECEIVRLEREKALETNELHMNEHRKLADAEKGRAAALAASKRRIVELENYIASTQTDREDENMRIELFSNQIEEMKARTQGVIDERNRLFNEKCNLENQAEEYRQREEAFTRDLQEARREVSSLASERDEATQKCMSMKDQQKELTKRVEALAGERDQLVQARTAATANSQSVSEKEKALVIECEQKTRALAILQKKLASAVAKIEKVTAQRGTFQRQRDEAGSRLRAAGVEFANLNSKLDELSIAKNRLQNELVQIRDERDAAMSRVEEMISLESQLKLTREGLDSKTKELENVQSKLQESEQEVATLQESNALVHQNASNLTREHSTLQGKFEVVSREKDLINAQKVDLEQEKSVLQQKLLERERNDTQLLKQLKSMEADCTTLKEKSVMDLGITKAELASEQELRRELQLRMSDLQNEVSESASVLDQIRRTVLSCAKAIRSDIGPDPEAVTHADLQSIENLLVSESGVMDASVAELVSRYGECSMKLLRNNLSVAQEYKTLQAKHENSAKLLVTLQQEKSELQANASEAEALRGEVESARRDLEAWQAEKSRTETEIRNLQEHLTHASAQRVELEAVHAEKVRIAGEMENLQEQLSHAAAQRAELEATHAERVRMASETKNLREQLGHAAAQRAELEARLEGMTHEIHEEIQRRILSSTAERDRLLQETEKATANLSSIWSMLRRSLGEDQIETLIAEANQYGEAEENVAVLALRATASIVAEVARNRSQIEDIENKLLTAEAEVARLVDRAEIAEQERDTAKGTNERLERRIKVSHTEGQEEARAHYEGIIGQLEDELEDTRQELSSISDKSNRSEKETSELRALCSKLTSQFNGRTNELDEAEEKVVYLQDQVTTLEEDLEDAHARLKKLEEDSAEARQSDLKRLTSKLEVTTVQLEEIEKECSRLRGAHDEAENIAKESRMLADTHKQAEENLQIAIEQLEAAQESAVEQRTIELQRKLVDAERRCSAATERETAAAGTQKQLSIRDDEIKELRGAIGRLADERVELKLELEKSLSRLNHPDAGGQLVDRRVVRQLLVSYFRVGSVRRRDVLELMSRMLAFSESDNIAVGLRRRALMDRLGSLVQAPELDDASLPPLGTVSDKWIEFLMKETEEGEEQAKGW